MEMLPLELLLIDMDANNDPEKGIAPSHQEGQD